MDERAVQSLIKALAGKTRIALERARQHYEAGKHEEGARERGKAAAYEEAIDELLGAMGEAQPDPRARSPPA